MDTVELQRRELASFLRDRRGRLDPRAAGVNHGHGRRRTSGLRREELATLAGVSLTWYTWLEQGRRIRASRQVLTSLADALRLDRSETEHLFRLAGEIPPQAEPEASVSQLSPQYLSLLEHLDPLPAFIINPRFDVLAWNEAFCVLLPHFEELPAQRRNLLHLTFHRESRALYPNWTEDVAQLLAAFRAQAAERLMQPRFVELVRGLEQEYPEFAVLWARRDLEPSGPSVRTFEHPELGRIELGQVKLKTADTANALIVHQVKPESALALGLAELVRRRSQPQPPATPGPIPAPDRPSGVSRRLPRPPPCR